MLSGKSLACREHLLVGQIDAVAEQKLLGSSLVIEAVQLVGT